MLTQARANILLATLVLLLGALLLLNPGKDTDQKPPPLSELSPDRVHRVSRTGPGGQTLTLQRQGRGWEMLTPYRVSADASRVRGLLAIGTQPNRARFPAVPEELASFGLDPPSIRLELDGEQLGFGRTDPVYFRRYVLYRGEVHLIDDYGYRHLISTPETFVSRSLIPPGAEILAVIGPEGEATAVPDQGDLFEVWSHAQALEVRKAPVQAAGASIELRLRHPQPSVRFVQAQGHPDLLIRPELGLAYRLSPDSALLKRLGVKIQPPDLGAPSPGY